MRQLDEAKLRFFTRKLLAWSRDNLRSYPWRRTRSPYRVLIAELMLRRTRADQVLPVYRLFMRRFPTLRDFLGGTAQEILKLLKPLGLRWRARNFISLRDYLEKHSIKVLPLEYRLLTAMPGIGDYVARALLCFTGESPVYLVDVNVIRLVCRFFGYQNNPELRRRKWFREIMEALTLRKRCREFVQVTLDLPATVCLPKKPKCGICPLFRRCSYGAMLSVPPDNMGKTIL